MDLTGLLAAHPVIDGHNDLLWTARVEAAYDFSRLDVGAGGTPTHTDLPRMRAGGMGAQFWSVYVPTRLTGDAAVSATLEQVDAARLLTSRYAEALPIVQSYLSRRATDQEFLFAGIIAQYEVVRGGLTLSAADRARVRAWASAYKGPQGALVEKYLQAMGAR